MTLVVQMLDSDVLYLHEAEYVNDNLYPEKGMHFPVQCFVFVQFVITMGHLLQVEDN